MKRVLALAPLVLLALGAPATAGGGCYNGIPSLAEAETTVRIEHACFGPEAVRVGLGTTVTWENVSGLPHNISGPAIDFADLPVDATHSKTFSKAGIYPYACTIHQGMSGVVLVSVVEPNTSLPKATNAATAAAVQPVASSGDGGGTSYVPWAVGGVALALLATVGLVTFTRRNAGAPLTAR